MLRHEVIELQLQIFVVNLRFEPQIQVKQHRFQLFHLDLLLSLNIVLGEHGLRKLKLVLSQRVFGFLDLFQQANAWASDWRQFLHFLNVHFIY